MRGAVAVVGRVAEGRARCRLDRAGALDRGGVDEQHLVAEAGALRGEDAGEPLDRLGQAGSALVEAGLLGQLGEKVIKPLARDGEEAAVRGDAHDRLGDAEGRELGATITRPTRKDEPGNGVHLAPIRRRIESIFWTCKDILTLERHGARTLHNLRARIAQRFLALAACVALNHRLGRPSRALVDYVA
jgi:hypothetical protein